MRNFQNKQTNTTSSNTGTWKGVPPPQVKPTTTTTNTTSTGQRSATWGGPKPPTPVNTTTAPTRPANPFNASNSSNNAPSIGFQGRGSVTPANNTNTTTTAPRPYTPPQKTTLPPAPANPPPTKPAFVPQTQQQNEDEWRSKPIVKPKPEINRNNSGNITKPPVAAAPVAPPPVVEKPKEEPKNDKYVLDVTSKWRINYDDLEFSDLISTGSAGEVYLGYYFGTPVAIKKLFSIPDDQKHLVAREYVMLTEVNHPNLVQFLGICDDKSGIYLITEYVEHGDLFDLLIFGERELDWKNKVKIALQVAQACFYLHSKGIIHRDLKSQNVLVGESFKVKLCDLGLATIVENKKRMTVCGTNEWMAPEIMLAESYDNKVDVFSFGIVLTELITNQPPKKREFSKMLAFDVPKFIESLPELCPEDFAQLVIDCTKFNPDQRPSFKEIVLKLRKLHESMDD